jgi:hypothetical protein
MIILNNRNDELFFRHIMASVEMTTLRLWIGDWLTPLSKKQKKKDAQNKQGGFTKWLFGKKEQREKIMSD